MCDMLISKDESMNELEFIVFNVVFSETRGKFTTDFVYGQLEKHEIKADRDILERLFERWANKGLIFEDANEYVINSMVSV